MSDPRGQLGSPEPIRPAPRPADTTHLVFARGRKPPKAIAWFGFRSFYGHLWHLAASAVATQDIDARTWMSADPPSELNARVAEILGGDEEGDSLTECLGSDLWIDYIADTGDDAAVSAAVADMVFRRYRLAAEQGEAESILPRGHILMFGGDTAYPVATDVEIHNRVCVPFNSVLQSRLDGEPRVLLGIPGNHDWYDGLDGFARMFRARRGTLDRASVYDDNRLGPGQIDRLVEWVEAFRTGEFVAKRATLPLHGYTPVQSASYFCLPLAPKLDWWAVDRQLRAVDYTQQRYFLETRDADPERGLLVMLPDPAFAMLEPFDAGQRSLSSLNLDLAQDAPLVMSGDTHHYCRQAFDRALHITAGGGGAFLHPTRIPRWGVEAPEAEFPGPRACLALALQVPWQIAGGRAGFIIHWAAALLYLPSAILAWLGHGTFLAACIVGGLATFASATLAGWRERHPLLIGLLASVFGAWMAALPWLCTLLVNTALANTALAHSGHLDLPARALIGHLLAIYPAALGFGTFLMVLTLLGLEQHHAFSALAHPGYKHFVRMRVRRDGSGIDGWVLGKVDTLRAGSKIVLVDQWSWNNPAQKPSNRAPTKARRNDHGKPG